VGEIVGKPKRDTLTEEKTIKNKLELVFRKPKCGTYIGKKQRKNRLGSNFL
jgi:hypothetical protein